MVSQIDNLQQVDLDIWNLDIQTIVFEDIKGQKIQIKTWEIIDENEEQGQQLQISLEQLQDQNIYINENQQFNIVIQYLIDSSSQAISFLQKEQTGTLKYPYLYSQAEAIYARSMIPLQDTPIVKLTYTAKVTCDKNLDVFMSANKTQSFQNNDKKVNFFSSDIPIPSYLIAIVAGYIEEVQVDENVFIIAEPDMIEKSVKDLQGLGQYIKFLEDYLDYNYIWGSYKIVILPPSFPMGGMENPLLTFASPSIIVGDGSGKSVAIHEIAHSWTGNIVTCGNWSNLWINEGYTVFLERKTQEIFYGQDFMIMDSIVGNLSLTADFNYYGINSNYSSLYPDISSTNPDDAFTEVPYEKGYQFLKYIETVIGENNMAKYLSAWLKEYQFQSVVWQDAKIYFEYYVKNNIENSNDLLSQIDWDGWVLQPGYQPMDQYSKIEFFSQKQQIANELAQQFIDFQGLKLPQNWQEGLDFSYHQVYIFIGHLRQNLENINPLILQLIQSCYDFNNSMNMEVQWRWYEVTIYGRYEIPKKHIFKFLGQIGREMMILPQYIAYKETGQLNYALDVYSQHYDFYHPITRLSIEQVLFD